MIKNLIILSIFILYSCDAKKDFCFNNQLFIDFNAFFKYCYPEKTNLFLDRKLNLYEIHSQKNISILFDSLCFKYKNNDSLDSCIDYVPIIFNYKDSSFYPNSLEKYNLVIPCLKISCKNCLIDFDERKILDIVYYSRDSIILINKWEKKVSKFLNYSQVLREIEPIIHNYIKTCIESLKDYSDYTYSNDVFEGYIESHRRIPLLINISIDPENDLLDLEPVFSSIVFRYIEEINIGLYNSFNKEICDLNIQEIKLFAAKLHLFLSLSYNDVSDNLIQDFLIKEYIKNK